MATVQADEASAAVAATKAAAQQQGAEAETRANELQVGPAQVTAQSVVSDVGLCITGGRRTTGSNSSKKCHASCRILSTCSPARCCLITSSHAAAKPRVHRVVSRRTSWGQPTRSCRRCAKSWRLCASSWRIATRSWGPRRRGAAGQATRRQQPLQQQGARGLGRDGTGKRTVTRLSLCGSARCSSSSSNRRSGSEEFGSLSITVCGAVFGRSAWQLAGAQARSQHKASCSGSCFERREQAVRQQAAVALTPAYA